MNQTSTADLHEAGAYPFEVKHVCHSEEADGLIVAVRWTLSGTTRPGGFLGEGPSGRPVAMMCAPHLRFDRDRIVEEWTVFDEVGVLAVAYRAAG